MSVSQDSVSPTVATALAPSLETKNTSQTANTLSITISSTMGMARMRMARDTAPSVKSRWEPRRASRTDSQNPPSACASAWPSVGGGAGRTSAVDSDIDVLTCNLVWLRIDGAGGERRKKIKRAAPNRGAALVTTRVLLRDQCLKTGMATTSTPVGPPNGAVPMTGLLIFAETGVFTAMTSGMRTTGHAT